MGAVASRIESHRESAEVGDGGRGTGLEHFEAIDLIDPATRGTLPRSGVKALMLAVFEDAIRCYFRGNPRVKAEAEHWIEYGPRYWAFSFDVICEAFGLSPAATRVALRRMRNDNPAPSMLRKRHRGTGRRPRVVARH